MISSCEPPIPIVSLVIWKGYILDLPLAVARRFCCGQSEPSISPDSPIYVGTSELRLSTPYLGLTLTYKIVFPCLLLAQVL